MASLDEVLDLLSKQRRRHLFYYLDEQDGPATVDELVTFYLRLNAASAVNYDPIARPNRMQLLLKQIDLPKAATSDFVRYDREEEIVELTNPPPAFGAFLTIAKEHDDSYPLA